MNTSVAPQVEYSETQGPLPRVDWIPKEKLRIDHRYQREITRGGLTHINKITANFNWVKFQPLCVSKNGDTYYVYDGQHRLEAILKHPMITEVPCYIFDNLTVKEQALAFVDLNTKRISVSRINQFWASIAAKNPIAIRIKKICDDTGVIVTKMGGVLPPKTLNSTYTIEKLLDYGDEIIVNGLKLLLIAVKDKTNGMRSVYIYALVTLYAETQDYKTLASMMRDIDMDAVLIQATTNRATVGGSLESHVFKVLKDMYQKRSEFKKAS